MLGGTAGELLLHNSRVRKLGRSSWKDNRFHEISGGKDGIDGIALRAGIVDGFKVPLLHCKET